MSYPSAGFPASGLRRISGASLAQKLRKMPLPARAVLGAEIRDGHVVVQNLTLQTIADLVGVSVSSLQSAGHATPEHRKDIKAGRRRLTQPPRQQLALPAPVKPVINDAEVISFVRHVGIDRVLDAAVAAEAAQ